MTSFQKAVLGLLIAALGIVLAKVETEAFGNHPWPQTPAEFICDVVAAVIALIGLRLFRKGAIEIVEQYKDQ